MIIIRGEGGSFELVSKRGLFLSSWGFILDYISMIKKLKKYN